MPSPRTTSGGAQAIRSGLQQRVAPAAPGPHEEVPIVQPVLAVAPELDRLRHEAETRPVRRTRHLVAGITAVELPPAVHERRATGERRALRGGERGEAA